MGGNFSHHFPCLKPLAAGDNSDSPENHDVIFTSSEPLDETLGHSFCYVRSSNHFLSPTTSSRFLSPSHSLRFDEPVRTGVSKTVLELDGIYDDATGCKSAVLNGFRSISGASVSANASNSRTVLELDGIYDDATGNKSGLLNGFESTSSFCALPLQTVRRNGGEPAGPIERGFFMSGPIERGAMSGPLDANPAGSEKVNFSAPLNGPYVKKRKKRGIFGISKSLNRKKPWVVPVLNFGGRKDSPTTVDDGGGGGEAEVKIDDNVQWALGKAGEDRVHVVVSEEHGWLFVGIYDGFNGPDAPEFLMGNLYRAVFNELEGLFWDVDDDQSSILGQETSTNNVGTKCEVENNVGVSTVSENNGETVRKVTFEEGVMETRRRKLFEFLAEEDLEDGLDLSGSQRFAFSVDDALGVNNAGSAVSRRWLLLSKLKQGLSKNKDGHKRNLIPWRFTLENKEKDEGQNKAVEEEGRESHLMSRRRKVGPIDHKLVLGALSKALELTELGYLDMTDKFLDRNPELALMGSCLLAVLMRDEDVYVMNVGDSRAIVAQHEPLEVKSNVKSKGHGDNGSNAEDIVEESKAAAADDGMKEASVQAMRLSALQLSTDHSTSIEEEILRIKNEHPDDSHCIVNDRVKGRLKVTRAFGAGFLKQPKFNNVLLEMFRNEYIGTAPYLSCTPSLRHHKLCRRDQFLILSSDGLYQYFSNQQVVSEVESFMEKFPDGDPAQHLIEELLFRAAKKAGMDFHELLDIPQGDRRKYHDDVTVMVISLEGRIWKSSGKYL